MPLSKQGKYRPYLCKRRENAARLKSLLDYIKMMLQADGSLSGAPPLFELMRLFSQEIMLSRAVHLLTTDDKSLRMQLVEGLFMKKPSPDAYPKQRQRYNEVIRTLHAKPLSEEHTVDFQKDPVVSPWERSRLTRAVNHVATSNNPWREDALNHYCEVWMPLRLCIATNGFHSFFAGCVKSKGTLTTNGETRDLYDISALYPLIVFDGNYYRWREDNAVVGKSPCFSFGCIFELGRLLTL